MPSGDAIQPGDEQAVAVRSETIMSHPVRIEHVCDKSKLAMLVSRTLACRKELGILTPASPESLPPIGEQIADEPSWRFPLGAAGREGVAHLRVWLTAGPEPGHLAVVTGTGTEALVTQSTRQIWAALARRYGPSLVLLEHHPAPETREGAETLDLVRVGPDGSSHWLGVWPTPEDNPRHAGLEQWMAIHGHRIAGKPASWFDSCQDDD